MSCPTPSSPRRSSPAGSQPLGTLWWNFPPAPPLAAGRPQRTCGGWPTHPPSLTHCHRQRPAPLARCHPNAATRTPQSNCMVRTQSNPKPERNAANLHPNQTTSDPLTTQQPRWLSRPASHVLPALHAASRAAASRYKGACAAVICMENGRDLDGEHLNRPLSEIRRRTCKNHYRSIS